MRTKTCDEGGFYEHNDTGPPRWVPECGAGARVRYRQNDQIPWGYRCVVHEPWLATDIEVEPLVWSDAWAREKARQEITDASDETDLDFQIAAAMGEIRVEWERHTREEGQQHGHPA